MTKNFQFTFLFIFLFFSEVISFDIDWLTDFRGKSSGHTTCNFLTLPVSSNVLARGLASSVGANDATDLVLFSANSALSKRNKFAVHHLQWLMGLKKEYAGAMIPVQDIGTFGFYSQIFSPGNIENARDIDEQPSDPSLIELAIGTTFARAFLKQKISLGIGLSYIESRLDHESARALSGALDFLFKPISQLSSHLYLSNFGTDISYGAHSEPLPLQYGLSVNFYPVPDRIPFTSKFNFNIGIGMRKIADEPVAAGISTGIKAGQYLDFVSGYEFNYGKKPSISGFGIGTGFHYGIYAFEAAWKKVSEDLGSAWSATVKIQLAEKKQRSAEDYYTIAENSYRRKSINRCRLYAKKALQLDPNMWKAYALLNRLHSEELRTNKQEIAIIYTGNLINQFLPPVNAGSLGGIARQASMINILRNQYPVTFTIQSGNMINPTADPLRAKLASIYIDHIGFDAVCAGNGEIGYGLKKLGKSLFHKKFISTNIKDNSEDNVIPYVIVENGGYKLYIASFTDNNLVSGQNSSIIKNFEPEKLMPSDARTADLRILIMHDTWQNITSKAQYLQTFDIIICGSLEQHFPAPMKIGKTFILSAGAYGQYLGSLILRFDSNKKLLKTDNRLIPMSSEITEDSSLDSIVKIISATIDLHENGDSIQIKKASTDGVFPFLSNRDSLPGIYLKLIGRNAEFPLTSQIVTCSKPVASLTASQLVYVVEYGDKCQKLEAVDLTGANRRLIQDSITGIEMAFTHDGKWIYYTAAPCQNLALPEIYRTSSSGGPSYKMIDWPQSSEHSVSFSSNNENMLFCSDRDGKIQIYLTNLSSEHPVKITDAPANHFMPTFSPDGQQIGYLSDRSNFGGKLDLWVYDRISGIHNQITHNSNVKSFCWLADSRTIIYSSGINLLDLTSVDISSYRFSKVISNPGVRTYSDRNPATIFVNGNQTVIFEREFNNGDIQIFGIRPDGSEERCIIDSKNKDWLK